MRKNFILILLMFTIQFGNTIIAQTIKSKDFIVSSLLPDNSFGRYNVGGEYFFRNKKRANNDMISISLNGAKVASKIAGQQINGYDIIGEFNLYTQGLMPRKWNEYAGFKLAIGKYEVAYTNNNYNYTFIGLGTGVQPIVFKIIAIKLSADIGYMRNGLSTTVLYSGREQPFYSGFAVIFNVGIGVRF